MNLLITGSNGFLGSAIVRYFENVPKTNVWKLSRTKTDRYNSINVDLSIEIPDLKSSIPDIIVHCAGKAHIVPKKIGRAHV